MADIVETINGAVIQHGHHNDRIYLMHLGSADIQSTLAMLDEKAGSNGYGKVAARILRDAWPDFKKAGYNAEAVIPGLYRGQTDGLFVAKYYCPERKRQSNQQTPAPPVAYRSRPNKAKPPAVYPASQSVVACTPRDCRKMSEVYRQVFESYPFPIHDPAYLKRAMGQDTLYYAVQAGGNIVALAAAEVDRENESVEMTDFATLPEWRQAGLADQLLSKMEKKTRSMGIKTSYTIARAASSGINRLFYSSAYRYAGLLVNNTHISGRIQSMAVWYKRL